MLDIDREEPHSDEIFQEERKPRRARRKKPETEDEQLDALEKVKAIVGVKETEVLKRIGRRQVIEQRWLRNLRQYHGTYEHEIQRLLAKSHASKVFLNYTGPRTDTMAARLSDLLFPTDDRNWGIKPTPVPELVEGVEKVLEVGDEAEQLAAVKADELNQGAADDTVEEGELEAIALEKVQAEGIVDEAQQRAEEFQQTMQEAKKRAEGMQTVILDQLTECRWQAAARAAILDGCKIGTGVLKGPVIGAKIQQKFTQNEMSEWEPRPTPDDQPSVQWVDPWSFYPDPDCRNVEDGNGVFERHMMNTRQLRKLQHFPEINNKALRRVLKSEPRRGEDPSYLTQLYNITGDDRGNEAGKFQIWEYRGPVEPDEFELLLNGLPEKQAEKMFNAIADEDGQIDPLLEIDVVMWFSHGELLSLALNPMASGDCIYSVFTLKPDEAGPFGFGIPHLMEDPQAILNGSIRMLMDNAGLSTGPQIVVNKNLVKPDDNKWEIRPRKVWLLNSTALDRTMRPFETFNIPSNQAELLQQIDMARALIDEVTGMPAIAQGEQGANVTKTAQGMALLMNSANIVFRRTVKMWDDDMTVPIIQRFYHWNMTHHDNPDIKGDYEVDARGSSVLLVREMQAQNLIMIAQMFMNDPNFGPRINSEALLKQIFRAHMISADEVLFSDREFRKKQEDMANSPDPATQAQMAQAEAAKAEVQMREREIDAKVEISNKETDTKLKLAAMHREQTIMQIAAQLDMDAAKLQAMLQNNAADRDSKERGMAVEAAMAKQTGEHAGGAI